MPQRPAHLGHDDIIYPSAIAFVAVHIACLGALWTGATLRSLGLLAAFYLVRMFAITGGFHRYFSHRSFKTSRSVQFLLAFVAQSSAQSGTIWWAAKHREHHAHSDTPDDVHSPARHGFFFAHVGWIFYRRHAKADYSTVPDLTRYPELRWLDRWHLVPAFTLAFLALAIDGWTGLFVGFFCSTALTYHGTFAINSLAHTVGRQRYATGDDSRNSWWLALITLGEGWHNNHHYYQSSTRQGFRWWEIDVTYYILRGLAALGIVWDLRSPPPEVVAGERSLPRPVVESVARRLAARFELDSLSAQARELLAEIELPEGFVASGAEARAKLAALLADVRLPELPSVAELRGRARETWSQTPSLDEIAERARALLVETFCERALPLAAGA